MNFDFDTENLFSNSRLEILKQIIKKPTSIVELSNELNTTIANISQQIKLLEYSKIVLKKKLPKKGEVGKPKSILKINNEIAHITLITKNNISRNMLLLEQYQKILLNAWNFIDRTIYDKLENFIIKNKHKLNNLKDVIYTEYNEQTLKKHKIFFVYDESMNLKELKKNIIISDKPKVEIVFTKNNKDNHLKLKNNKDKNYYQKSLF